MTLDFESDQFLTLLTDALRAGPGSPAWHEAVNKLKQEGVEGADEYKLLFETRQNLESGRPYREIRAGAGFTKKVMSAIDEESTGPGRTGIPTPTIITIVAALVGIAVIVLIAKFTGKQPVAPSIADLQGRTFTHDLLTASFDHAVPAGWNKIGAMKLSFDREMRPADQSNDRSGGGIVTAVGIPASQPVSMEVTIRPPNAGDDFIMQVFVSDDANFSADRGTSAHELVWDIQSVKIKNEQLLRPQVVLPDGTFAATGEDISGIKDSMTIRIALDANFAIVDSDGKRLYEKENHLSPDKPRYYGVRFLTTRKSWTRNMPLVESVRILK